MKMKTAARDFPILSRKINGKRLVYLDSAATAQKPLSVIEAEMEFYTKSNANVHRGMNTLSRMATEIYEQAHSKTAKFINAKGMQEIIFTKNTTESLNLLAYSLGEKLKSGDEILLTKMEHHANLVPWQQLAKRKGAVIKFADITIDGRLDMDGLASKAGRRTKIIAATGASNILGTVNPAKEIAKIAKDCNACSVIDAAQAVPHIAIDVKRIGCDFLAFSAHKMLGPTGIGVLHGREGLLEEMDPFLTGGDMISSVTLQGAEWNVLPWKFEAGTPNIAGAAGFGAAIEYLEKTGMENVEGHEKELLKYALKRIGEIENVKIYGPAKGPRVGVVPFNIEGMHAHDVSEMLDRHGIIIRAGNHCAQPLMHEMGIGGVCRASFYIYNTKRDIDALAIAIGDAKKVFGV